MRFFDPRYFFFISLVGLLLARGAHASAAEPTAADRAAAEALFNQARTLMDAGNYAPACEKLQASSELDPTVGTMLYLGDCYEKADRLASAWMAFEDARLAAIERKDTRSEIAAVRAAALKPRLVYLVVELTGAAPEGLEVRANGRVLSMDQLGEPAPVDAGPVVVVAMAPGFDKQELRLEALAGAKEPYRAILQPFRSLSEPQPMAQPAPPKAPDEPPPPEDDGGSQRTVAYIVGGIGVAALAAGGVFALLAKGNNDDSLSECDDEDPNRCSVRGKSLRDDAISKANIATIAGIAGGVALAAGVTLYVTAPTGPERAFGLRIGGSF
jgi:hypothetical protein